MFYTKGHKKKNNGRYIRLCFANIVVFIVFIFFIEILGQLGYYTYNGHWIYENHSLLKEIFEPHPYLVATLKKNIQIEYEGKKYSSTPLQTRWTGSPQKNSSTIRIAILGGSTTFGTGVSDQDSWPAILQSLLGENYSVYNYGMPGYSTSEAIIQMGLVVPTIKPHVIILYQGWNDIHHYHVKGLGSDYREHGIRQFKNLNMGLFQQGSSFIQEASQVLAIFNFANVLGKSLSKGLKESVNQRVKEIPDPFVDEIYQRNLKTLRALSENMNAHTVFIPQILNYASFEDSKKSRAQSPHIIDRAMPKLMSRFNSLLLAICEEGADSCKTLNEVLEIPWAGEDFIDDGHFSRDGGEKFAWQIAKYIKQL